MYVHGACNPSSPQSIVAYCNESESPGFPPLQTLRIPRRRRVVAEVECLQEACWQRWQSIPSRSIWLEIGSRLIEPSKGLSSKYRALNRTELKWLDDRTEPSQPSYTIEPSRTFNLNARCSIKRLDLARSF